MKIIHIADIHWRGLSRHDEYRESFCDFFEKAKGLKPDVIYVGGDIVHSKTQGISPELIENLTWWFESLAEIAPVHMILGNHDGLMMNKHRQDAITPLVSALDNSRIHLYKKSGIYPTGHPGFNWCVFSCFDEEGWRDVGVTENEINMALFHGAVWGSKTDIDWDIQGDVTSDFFSDFDFTLLGDIHRRQFLNDEKTIAYCGSTIQQNYGEDTGKGFLFWDIRSKDDFDVSFHEVYHSKPFITLEWKGTVKKTVDEALKYPVNSRFRIKSKLVLTQAHAKQLQLDLYNTLDASEVVFIADKSFSFSSIQSSGDEITRENLRESKTIKRLLRDFHGDSLSDEIKIKLDMLVDEVISEITDENEVLRNTRWKIDSMKFDNLFSYGENNVVNFKNLSGITGIFGKNTKGKSSIIGSLMYALFNTTDRGSIKNEHIVNSRKNNCKAEVDLVLNGSPIRVSRSTVKHQTRKGETYATTSLSLQKLDKNGEIVEDLTEEQRRETEKILRKMIGTSDDFLMTSLASQGDMNTFINEGATSRKALLTKFLDLVIFEKMYDACKDKSSELRVRVKHFPNTDIFEEIDEISEVLESTNLNLKDINNKIKNKSKSLQNAKVEIATSSTPDVVTKKELKLKQKTIKDIISNKLKTIERISFTRDQILLKEEKIRKISLVQDDFSIDEIESLIEAKKNLEKEIITLRHNLSSHKSTLEIKKESVRKLDLVPCGDSFPTCMFIKDSHNNKSLILECENIVKNSEKTLETATTSLSMIENSKPEEKLNKFNKLSKKKSDLEIQISALMIEVEKNQNILSEFEKSLSLESIEVESMKLRVVPDDDSGSSLRSRIISLEEELKALDADRCNLLQEAGGLEIKINQIKEQKKDFENIKRDLYVYDLFLNAVSKKGIPLKIMMSQLPAINAEIAKILQGVAGFTVELEAVEDSNAMDVYINYGDSRRVIELASGMEKMMSSLAIRAALINVSSLSKTNMLIIDEGFGALDSTNLEACNRLLNSLKKWFKNIIVISHVDSIKDAVDNSIEITKKEKDSHVEAG
jgi:DNA repair exonuclease SbcCD ATPase subunit